MYRGKVTIMAVAVFTLGVAFAAQPTSVGADRRSHDVRLRTPWTPGTNGVIAIYESSTFPLAPPQ
jgi:hypothetical protein